jgi:membrane protease YdiL (CAAX protease family)
LTRFSGVVLALSALLGIVALLPFETLRRATDAIVSVPHDAVIAPHEIALSASPVRAASVLTALVIAGPWAQELFFRGALYRSLRNAHGAVATGAVVGLCFVVAHVNLYRWLPLVFMAVLLSHVREVTRSIVPCFLVHSAFNAAVFACEGQGWVVVGAGSRVSWPVLVLGWPVMCLCWYAMHRQALVSGRRILEARRDS